MMRYSSLVLILAALSTKVSAAIGPNTQLSIVNKVIAPDGYPRDTVLANGVYPGPLIQGKKGDGFSIGVVDDLKSKGMDRVTSIHWHGLFQTHTNYADGGAFVNQCPIVPGESFRYQFNSGNQAGTFWYHSHYQAQYCDGLRGPLVIYDPQDPHRRLYDVDNDHTVVTLGDWYHYPSLQAPDVPLFNSTLINGRGRYSNGPPAPFAVVNVIRGLRYRLRLVSISCDPAYKFSIDKHQLTVIEADGINVQPLTVDSLDIFAGQRYSVVLNANRPVGNYWIRALPNFEGQDYSSFRNLAILRYLGAIPFQPEPLPPQIEPSVLPLKETDLHPLVRDPVPGRPVPGGADININLEVKIDLVNGHPLFFVNGTSFKSPDVPVLLQILSRNQNASDLLPKGSVYPLQGNKSVEISIPAGAQGGPHPIHLHGHAFHVVRSAGNSTYNYDNPVVRDVVSIGDVNDNDNVTIRFFTDNPGPWFMHCHIDWHLEKGFAVVFAEDVPDVPQEVKPTGKPQYILDHARDCSPINVFFPPAEWNKLCPAYNTFEKNYNN
ncbi:laccase T2 copper depleted [Russula brevipes]|nr:laccase T2 copper depleted [Russula brevipes]